MNYEEMTVEELNVELKAKLHSCAMWKSTTDGSYGMAMDASGYFDVLDAIKLKEGKGGKRVGDMEKRITDLEEFLEVARIPDSQEWRRKELRGHSL